MSWEKFFPGKDVWKCQETSKNPNKDSTRPPQHSTRLHKSLCIIPREPTSTKQHLTRVFFGARIAHTLLLRKSTAFSAHKYDCGPSQGRPQTGPNLVWVSRRTLTVGAGPNIVDISGTSLKPVFQNRTWISGRDIVMEGQLTTSLQTADRMWATRLPYLRVIVFCDGHRWC